MNTLSSIGILEILPKDIIDILFDVLSITAKRNFTRCNHTLNRKTILMTFYENAFISKINKFYEYHLPTKFTKLEKITLEMIYDDCEHLIPPRYICEYNRLCYNSPFMHFYCAKVDNIPLLKILIVFCPKYCKFITSGAAYSGHLSALKWARENGCKWNSWTCRRAAENGHLDVLKWARLNGCDWGSKTCSYAAKNGHLHVLKWARENGCEWDSKTCRNAAANEHFDVLKWAIENGCPEK